MSETQRTDEQRPVNMGVSRDFARKLERELATTARAELADVTADRNRWASECGKADVRACELERELKAANKRVAELENKKGGGK